MAVISQYIADDESLLTLKEIFSKKQQYKMAINYLVKYLQMPTTHLDMKHYCKYLGYLKKAYELEDLDIQPYIQYLKKVLND